MRAPALKARIVDWKVCLRDIEAGEYGEDIKRIQVRLKRWRSWYKADREANDVRATCIDRVMMRHYLRARRTWLQRQTRYSNGLPVGKLPF